MTIEKTTAETAYLEAFGAGRAGALAPHRRTAFERFAESGLPHRRLEDWKWTDLRRVLAKPYPPLVERPAPSAEVAGLVARSPFGEIARARLVFADGWYVEDASSMPVSSGVDVTAMTAVQGAAVEVSPREDDPLDQLNIAYASDGAVIRVQEGANTDIPIELIFVTTGAHEATHTLRNVIEVADGASATIIETHIGAEGACVANTVMEIRLGRDARLDRIKLQHDGPSTVHLSNLLVTLGEQAVLNDFTLTAGGEVTRNQGFITFAGEHARANVSGAYLLDGKQHADTRLVVDHAVPNCVSRELFKCVMDDEARGIFQGKVIVRQDAQKTDGKQSSHALLLTENAEFDAKPELEIYADDVVCGHGATSGELDENLVFYLRSRGIPEARAKAMLIAAFAAEAFDSIENEAIRNVFNALAHDWLDESTGHSAHGASE